MKTKPTDDQIRKLQQEAFEAGDDEMAKLCSIALKPRAKGRPAAIWECAAAIRNGRG